jgi:hypothetical protein
MHQGRLPRNLSRRSGCFFGPVLAGSSPSPHPTLSSRQPGRRAGFLEDLNKPAEAVIGCASYKIILNLKKVL